MCFKMSMPEMPKVETTARELVPSSESLEPNAPILGTDSDFQLTTLKKGKSGLKILPVLDPPSLSKASKTSYFTD